MPYVKRSPDGRIVGVYHERATPELEPISRRDPELRAFVARVAPDGSGDAGWISSDLAMARVVEDLVDTLIDRNVIGFDDLPEDARRKILERRKRRSDFAYLATLGPEDAGDE